MAGGSPHAGRCDRDVRETPRAGGRQSPSRLERGAAPLGEALPRRGVLAWRPGGAARAAPVVDACATWGRAPGAAAAPPRRAAALPREDVDRDPAARRGGPPRPERALSGHASRR